MPHIIHICSREDVWRTGSLSGPNFDDLFLKIAVRYILARGTLLPHPTLVITDSNYSNTKRCLSITSNVPTFFWRWKWKWKSLCHVQLFAIPCTADHQAPLSMSFFRWEYWSGLLFPSPGISPTQGWNRSLPHCGQILYHLSHRGSLVWRLGPRRLWFPGDNPRFPALWITLCGLHWGTVMESRGLLRPLKSLSQRRNFGSKCILITTLSTLLTIDTMRQKFTQSFTETCKSGI